MSNKSNFPLIRCVHQSVKNPPIADLKGELRAKIVEFNLKNLLKPNDTVAITAGSRGINNLRIILKTLVDYLKELKTSPKKVSPKNKSGYNGRSRWILLM